MRGAEEIFPGSGEMARLMRAHDWERSELGDPSRWPRELRTCVQVCLESRFPIVLWWGEDLRLLYNDAWRPALGALKHPAIDRPGREVWAEIWHIIGPQLAGVVETGEATWSTDMLLPMDRFGYREETYWTYSYSPIRDDEGHVCGVFTPVAETTQRVVSARRLRMLQRLGEAGSDRSVEEACALVADVIGRDPADIPFARIYLAEDRVAREAAATSCVPADVPAGAVDLDDRGGRWPWAAVRRTGAPATVALETRSDTGGQGAWGPARLASVHALSSPTGGDPIGYLVAGISPARSHDDAYRDFLALVAQNAATLLVNAAALDDERRRAQALATLQNLTAALSEALTPSAVAGALIDIGLPLLGGVAGGLMVVDDDARVLRSVRLGGYPDGSADREWRIPLAERTPLTDAVRHRAIRHAESSDEAVRRWPSMEAFRIAHSLDGALAAAPIVSGGRALGALAVRYPATGPLGDDARRLLETVARLTGPALLRSSHYILQHSVAETLQRSLLPLRLPSVDGLSIAAGYTAAGEGIEAGGDWYDAIELPGDRLALMVGDVVGRGPRAAAVMGQLRSALRAFASDRRDGPGEIVANLSRFASTIDGADVATACYAELDLAGRRLRYVCAGHPPPLVLTADGATRYLEGGRGVPLGVRERGEAYAEGETGVPPGATVMLYTDGLVERRGRSIDAGFGDLAAALARRRSLAPSDVTDGILAELGGSGDDCALLICRIDPPARTLEIEVGADARELRTVRAELREWLAGLGVPPADVEDVVLASGEALANSVEHGHGSRGVGAVFLRAAVDATRSELDVEVVDDGRWRTPPADPGDRGRGFALMRALMERVDIAHDDRGTRIAMRRRLHPGRIPPSPLPARPPAGDDAATGHPSGSVLRLEGDIDASNAAELMRDLAAPDTRVTTVDLTGVAVLGSAGIQLLFAAARRLRDRGETLEIVAAPGSLSHRLLELTDLGSLCAVRSPGPGPAP
ncbi:MAG: SpoIIE family protein phosphatase [Thermoleophilia bacterium]|nr:SpoIIE family protein phosphatase [Thermoleophilia bacterium]